MKKVLRMSGRSSVMQHIAISQQSGAKIMELTGWSENIIPEIRIIFSFFAKIIQDTDCDPSALSFSFHHMCILC